MSTVYMIYPPRLIYISTSLFNVFHPRRLFSRVFHCVSFLCFVEYDLDISVPRDNMTGSLSMDTE